MFEKLRRGILWLYRRGVEESERKLCIAVTWERNWKADAILKAKDGQDNLHRKHKVVMLDSVVLTMRRYVGGEKIPKDDCGVVDFPQECSC